MRRKKEQQEAREKHESENKERHNEKLVSDLS